MKKVTLLVVLGLCLSAPSYVMAQSSEDHGQVGVFADYLRFGVTSPEINFVGIGGRAAVNVHRNIALEAEMAYDFKRNFTTVFDNGVITTFTTTRFRPLTGLFGPKFSAGSSGPLRVFVTGKLGFVNFSSTTEGPIRGFASQLGAVTAGDTRFALYPGGGIEGFWGPFGLRLDVGDQIYFDDGAHHNLKVTFGPAIRF
ncbi:MAG TPA: hypothetical protein VMT28_05275 [Terriglobales bacterium]|jgi:hypothetical protein|nr:hypothetical protein [Terriglobales bacterium]